MNRSAFPVLISVHDVMPSTLGQVRAVMQLLEKRSLAPVTLLVSPGFGWDSDGIAELLAWQARGHRLAGHGWYHRARQIDGGFHRVYSACISRTVAEHLGLGPEQIADMIRKCFEWFVDHSLAAPKLYVPPAWAMGTLSRDQLRALPFRWYETLTGIYDSSTGFMHRLPLLGFEADNAVRAIFLRMWNEVNLTCGRFLRRPVRIAIHPNDLSLRISKQLRCILRLPMRCVVGPG